MRPQVGFDAEIGNAAVPKFLLQPLVENALRHGIARRSGAGLLQVSARQEGGDLVLAVRDDGPGLPAGGLEVGGVGLSNTRARLAALYGERGTLEVVNTEGGGVAATVRLPYHEAQSDVRAPR